MGSTLRKLKREKKATSPLGPIEPTLHRAYNKGFDVGAKEQRKSDIEHLTKMLQGLEDVRGIGEKTAWKVREYFLSFFERRENHGD